MNPYEILGVSSTSTDVEIRSAYRRLVKQYHPDRNRSEEAREKIQLINEAYDILSNAYRRGRYDNPYTYAEQPTYEEDPREVYRRAYLRKRYEREKQIREAAVYSEQRTLKIFRMLSVLILIFALLIILDRYLPTTTRVEKVITGWQEHVSKHTYASYIKTENNEFRVPHEIHLNYPYYMPGKPPLVLHITPIFRSVKTFEFTFEKTHFIFASVNTLSSLVYLPWLLILSSLFTILRKEYTLVNYSLCFMPAFLFTIIIYYTL